MAAMSDGSKFGTYFELKTQVEQSVGLLEALLNTGLTKTQSDIYQDLECVQVDTRHIIIVTQNIMTSLQGED